ncbi:MAG: monofunctional biosynthetic peptidoglycan transglycosylase [Alphaproteobacteria bacterium]
MARTKSKAKKSEGKRRRFVSRLIYWPLRVFAHALAGAILLVGAFTVIDPPGGYYLAVEWVRLGHIEREWRDLEDISPDLARAVMAGEDANFCAHWGFDLKAIEQAIEANARGRRVRGASTISQQVAKNLFLWHGRSWLRKGLEAGFTVLIETIWTKRRIVEVYLNIAEFGDGVFGAQAAARHHFGRDAAALTLDQSTRLAAVLPNPKGRNPRAGTAFMTRRAAAIADGARTLEGEGRAGCVG